MALDPVTLIVAALANYSAASLREEDTKEAADQAAAKAYGRLRELVRSRAADDASSTDAREAEEALEAVKEEPTDPQKQKRLRRALFNIASDDDTFVSDLSLLVADDALDEGEEEVADNTVDGLQQSSESPQVRMNGMRRNSSGISNIGANPVRGFLGLTVSATSPQTTAGSDFSIFVLVQNPFDVPITIHHVQTHIPVDLVDVNQWRAKVARAAASAPGGDESTSKVGLVKRMHQRRNLWREHPGVATAIGTEITPEEASDLFKSDFKAGRDVNIGDGYSAVKFVLPRNPSSDDLDALMRRVIDYRRGTLPVRLQPGDSVVRQFVLRTRSRIFFRPLSHSFQIQVSYSVDGADHTGTIPYDLTIQAALGSISEGSVAGAVLGTLVKSLSHPTTASINTHPLGVLQALAVSVMASFAVVIAFARKSSVQPLVSVEDFWGGLVIGFTVGYFGFQTFFGLFKSGG